MAINAGDFDFVYRNYDNIIDSLAGKKNRTKAEDKLFSDALLMDKLVHDSQQEGSYD